MDKKLSEKIKNLPQLAGVYIMRSARGGVIYVGKALSLRKRVNSYFNKKNLNTKTTLLLNEISDIDYVECDTEAQALILEASLIKEKKPKYNISLRDDKSYPYIEISKEPFGRIHILRSKNKSKSYLYGPFPNVKLIKEALQLIRIVFPYRTCKNMPKKPCLFYHIKLCPAPCISNVSKKEYKETLVNISKILLGQKKSLVYKLEKKMSLLAIDKKFEQAALIRDKLFSVYNLYSGKLQLHQAVALKDLLKLSKLPLVIEAIDISNILGKEATGSVVVFRDGVPDKNSYRRYRIKEVKGPDDYACIGEVLERRYSRFKEKKVKGADLIIIDGGFGHVNAAKKIMDKLSLKIPLIGIAKKSEKVWLPQNPKPIILSKNNTALQLIQRLRDEAHRFAKKYHTLLRSKKMISSK